MLNVHLIFTIPFYIVLDHGLCSKLIIEKKKTSFLLSLIFQMWFVFN